MNAYAEAERLAAKVVGTLAERGATLALAESCTGGLVAALITDVPGASAVLIEGLVVYSNEAKQRRLGVKAETLEREGAVSAACVRELAENLRAQSGATYAGAISGIAGPGGGSADKPVGLVFLALAGPGGIEIREERFRGERHEVRAAAAATLLTMVLFSEHGKDDANGR